MAREKNVPKMCNKAETNWNMNDNGFRPVIRKRKIRKIKKTNGVNINLPISKRFYVGKLLIGTTNNVFPDKYSKCNVTFNHSSEDDEGDELDTILIECDKSLIVLVRLSIDTEFLKELCKTKIFALIFEITNEEVFADIYFMTLPLLKFTTRIGNCIKNLFKLMYNIETNTALEFSPSNCEKNLHGNMEILNLFKKISTVRESRLNIANDENVQHPCLKPKLRPYQEKAVRWMLYREKIIDDERDTLHPLYITTVLKSGENVYYDKYTGYIDIVRPTIPPCIKGGILADEMGLGKTIEVLACILLNRKPSNVSQIKEEDMSIVSNCVDPAELEKSPVINKQSKKRKIPKEYDDRNEYVIEPKKLKVPNNWIKSSSKKTATRIALELWYTNILIETKTKTTTQYSRDEDTPLVQCICGNTSEKGIIECDCCGKYQHRACLGYNKTHGRYLCPQCWMDEPLLECGGTLIVTPVALRTQWCNEVSRHVRGGLKVLQYEGYSATPVYPTQLKDYDLVITTYNVLKAELRLTENGQIINLRRERKYSPPGSPLIRMKWWRLCLDEAQTVESPGVMVSEMAKKIDANFRWAITGTPISKNISDLYGLIDYLQITPFNDPTTWKHILYDPYTSGNEVPMLNFMSDVLWRTSKIDVLDQINIPKQTYKEHFLEFSAVEKYFYKREHELSSNDFLFGINKYDPSLLLGKMDKRALKKILAPLISLRHACTHPNTARGRYLATKKHVTSMKDLLDALILKNVADSEECLRLVISSLNGLAGIQLLLQNPQESIEHYREVLQLAARFEGNKEGKLTIDKLQIIHTMHNLAETLDICQPKERTLRDDTMRQDCADMEQKYVEKFMKETATAFESSNAATAHVEHLLEKFILKQDQWFSDGLDWVTINHHYDDLLKSIDNACDNASVQSNLGNDSHRHILKIVYSWNEDIFNLRSKLFKAIGSLYEQQLDDRYKIVIKNDLVVKAMNCHLRPQKKNKSSSKCPVCLSNVNLKQYEGKLFNMRQRKTGFEDMSLQGSWKLTLEEIIFKSLLGLLKTKNGRPEYVKDGEVHISLIEALKKEFKEIRKLWTFLDQQICAQDEVDICKVRLQLKDPEFDFEGRERNKVLKNLSYNLENKNETCHLYDLPELNYQNNLLQREVRLTMKKLDNSLGTLNYLNTLRKQQYEGQSPDPCPICKNSLENHWSILPCGHSYCLECIQLLLERNVGDNIQCSVCRSRQRYYEISYIKAGSSMTEENQNKIKGNYSTKIEAIITLLLELKEENPKVKVLLFSSWMNVLKCLEEALMVNRISCELALSAQMEARIENFKDEKKKVTVLLLPIAQGSKGLNLVEATHVILAEPLLNPADELQAVGRVHRIGQKKPTTVHKFLIKNTIEESIHQATSANAEIWDKNKVTLRQLTDLFMNDFAASQEVDEETPRVSSDFPYSTGEASTSTA